MSEPVVAFARLTDIDLDEVLALLNEPRNARHMPLVGEPSTHETAAAWISAKDRQWEEHGYGPWAILLDGEFAGWGGFQAERDGADLALVLHPRWWGRGAEVARGDRRGVRRPRAGGRPHRTALQPATRCRRGALGFLPDGEATHGEVRFRRYRLTRERWRWQAPGASWQVPEGH